MKYVPETVDEVLGLTLRAWRERRGLTGAEAATAVGASQSSWSRYETGQTTIPITVFLAGIFDAGEFIADARDLAARHHVAGFPGISPPSGETHAPTLP